MAALMAIVLALSGASVASAQEQTYVAFADKNAFGGATNHDDILFVAPGSSHEEVSPETLPLSGTQLVYCFNKTRGVPWQVAALGKKLGPVSKEYDEEPLWVRSYGDLQNFASAKPSDAEVLKVIYNGFDGSDADRAGVRSHFELSAGDFYHATQLALWHLTDGINLDSTNLDSSVTPSIQDAAHALVGDTTVEGVSLKEVPDNSTLELFQTTQPEGLVVYQHLLGARFVDEETGEEIPEEPETPEQPQPSTVTETTTTTVPKDCDCTPKTVTTTVPTVTSTVFTSTETATVTPTTFTSTPTVTTTAEAQTKTKTPNVVTTTLETPTETKTPDVVTTTLETPTETETPDVVTTTLETPTETETPDVVTTTLETPTETETAPNVTETVTQTETVTATSTENAPTVTTTVAGETVTVTADATTTTVTPAPVTEVAATETVTPAPVTETAAPSTVTVTANPVTKIETPKPTPDNNITVEEKANGALVVIVRDRFEKVVERIEVPTGWNVEEGKVKEITPTRDEKGNIILHITFVDGKTTTINASQQKQVAKTGSSDNEVLQRCWANAKNSPIFWLLPVGILVAVGAPVINQVGGPVKEQMDRLNAEIAKQFQWNNQNNNNRRPAGHGGQGIERDNNRRNAGAGDIAAQVDELNRRLGQAFGSPEVQQAGGILAVVAALGATAGLMYYWCSNEPTEDGTPLLSSKLNAKKD